MSVSHDNSGAGRVVEGPLSGLLVLDFGMAAVGPVAASYMSMLGATVIKIEQPSGDIVRKGTPTMKGTSTTFIGNNVGKFGLVLDLKSDADRARAVALASVADVVIDNFRSADVMVRLGLGYFDVLQPRNPRLVYLQSSAYGASGPWKGMTSADPMAQASGGLVGSTGERDGLPEFSRGSWYFDWSGAMMNTIAMLAGLRYREKFGEGLMLETSQFGSSVHTGLTRLVETVTTTPRHGSTGTGVVPDRMFATSDGYLAVCAPTDGIWARLCEAIGRPELVADQNLSTMRGRFAHREQVEGALAEALATRSTQEWTTCLREARVPCSPHDWNTTISSRLLEDAQVAANAMMARQDSWFGDVLTQTPHWTFGQAKTTLRRASPTLGEHSELIVSLLEHLPAPPEPAQRSAMADSSERAHDDEANTVLFSDDAVLSSVRVVEVGSGLAVAVAGMVLQRLGAEVVKLEHPDGDWLRAWGGAEGDSVLWNLTNVGKDVQRCDLKSPAGATRLADLVRESDVIVVSGPPSARERLGCGYDAIHGVNPNISYCGISGWGIQGPLADQPATELDVQTAAGMTLLLGRKGAEPLRQGFDLVSMNTGYAAAEAVLAMLHQRSAKATTEGDQAEVSMLHSAIALNQGSITAEGNPDAPTGMQFEKYDSAPDHGYACRDGRLLISLRGDEDAWTKLFLELDRADLLDDERFATVESVRQHQHLLPNLLEADLAKWTYGELEELIRVKLGGTIVPVLEPHEVMRHPQTSSLGFLQGVDAPEEMKITLPILHVRPAEPDGRAHE